MTNIWNSNFNVGDKVLYLGSETIPYDKDLQRAMKNNKKFKKRIFKYE